MKRFFPLVVIFFPLIFLACGTDFSSETAAARPKNAPSAESDKNMAREDEDNDKESETEGDGIEATEKKREWTIMVYMAADNNLESDAITDFNELEQADTGDCASVLVLLDRAEKYDATNGDWTDTRLYEIRHDDRMNKSLISSERLDCPLLDLKKDSPTELDMANPQTLRSFIEFARSEYKAENYALIIWGHGTGWRGAFSSGAIDESSTRAVALDDASESYMTISQIRSAVNEGMNGEKLSVIGFDTCFGMCIETAYELSDCATYMLGTPSLVPESGWNYTEVMNVLAKKNCPAETFCKNVCESYSSSYKNYPYAAFSWIKLEKIPALVSSFSAYSASLADFVSDESKRKSVFDVFERKTVSYRAVSFPTDFYVDIGDLLSGLNQFSDSSAVKTLLNEAEVYSWSASGSISSMALFFCVYQANGVISQTHPSMYRRDSRDTLLSRFVLDCGGYVPSGERKSLLDKLFYTNY